jgi:hypothetical protein
MDKDFRKSKNTHLVLTTVELTKRLNGEAYNTSGKRTRREMEEEVKNNLALLASLSAKADESKGFCITPVPQEAIDDRWDIKPPSDEAAITAIAPFKKWVGVIVSRSRNGAAAVAWTNLNNRKGAGLMRENKARVLGWNKQGLLSDGALKQFGYLGERKLLLTK